MVHRALCAGGGKMDAQVKALFLNAQSSSLDSKTFNPDAADAVQDLKRMLLDCMRNATQNEPTAAAVVRFQ